MVKFDVKKIFSHYVYQKTYRISVYLEIRYVLCFCDIYLIFIVIVFDAALYLDVAAALIVILTVPFLRNTILP